MNFVIFNFSGTGNTYFVAKQLQADLQSQGSTCSILNLESSDSFDALIAEADVIGLGYPIYGSDMPQPVHTFIEGLKNGQGKRAFVFCTQVIYSGDGAAVGARLLRKKGFNVRQLAHFNMPNNITDFKIVRWIKPASYEKLSKKVALKSEKLAKRIVLNQKKRKGQNPLSLCLGLLQRGPYRLGKKFFTPKLKIDKDCVLCKKCIELCPSQHLKKGDNNIMTEGSCYLCYRCINHCPVQALHFTKRAKVKRPYHGPTKDFDIYEVMK